MMYGLQYILTIDSFSANHGYINYINMYITLAFKKGLQLIYHTTIRRRGCCLAEFAFILCLSKQYIVCTV